MGEVGQMASGRNCTPLAHSETLCELGKGAPSSPWKPARPALISACLGPLSRHNQMHWLSHLKRGALLSSRQCVSGRDMESSLPTVSDLFFRLLVSE